MDGIVKCVAVVVLLLALLGIAACGDDEPPGPARTKASSPTPSGSPDALIQPQADDDRDQVVGTFALWQWGGWSTFLELKQDGSCRYFQRPHHRARFQFDERGTWTRDDERVVLSMLRVRTEEGWQTGTPVRRRIFAVVDPDVLRLQDGREPGAYGTDYKRLSPPHYAPRPPFADSPSLSKSSK